MEINPYAPATDAHGHHSAAPVGGEPVWREGDVVSLWKVAPFFPSRCVVCNEHAPHRIKKTVYWHESWIYLTLLGGILIYAIAAAILRKSAFVDYGLCARHKLRRTLGFVTIFGGFALGFGFIFGMLVNFTGGDLDWVFLVGLAFLLGCSIAGIIMTQTIKPTRIDDHRAWFKTGAPFRDSLSPYPTPPVHAGFAHAPTHHGTPPQGFGPAGYGPSQPQGYGPPRP